MPCGKTKLSKEDMERIKKHYQTKQGREKATKPAIKLKKVSILKKRKKRRITEPKKFRYNTSGDFIGGGYFF